MRWHTAIISHKRPQNIHKIQEITGPATFYVNIGEGEEYLRHGAKNVVECGTNICQARNRACDDAHSLGLPSVQCSDDLKKIKLAKLQLGEKMFKQISFNEAVTLMISKLEEKKYFYGGVAVTNNPLNYTGDDYSYDKLIVNDLICIMPSKYRFDESVALKEDYDMSILQLIEVGGVVRCNNILCEFPHRENIGGANDYRNESTELTATNVLIKKWPSYLKPHATRPGQVSLNYPAIRKDAQLKQYKLF